jgi:peptide/nickel transport system substrate-binding protein
MVVGEASAQDRRDTLRVGVNAANTFLGNPFMARGVPAIYFKPPLFQSLTNIDPDGKLVAELAASWQLVDNTTWRFKLVDGYVFTNGAKNDAANAVRNIDWLMNTAEGKTQQMFGVLKDIAEAKDVGNNTLEIKTKVPQPLIPQILSEVFLVESKAWVDMGIQQYAPKPVTSGPWKVVTYSADRLQAVEYENAVKKPKIKNIVIQGMGEAATRVQAIVSDQMDITTNMTPDDIPLFRNAGHRAETFDAPQTMTVAFYEQKPGFNPFKDRRVRVAANMAINRDDIVKGLMGNLTKAAHQAVTPRTNGYVADLAPYKYDPEGAKKLLAEAGYANGFDTSMQVTTGSLPFDKEIYSLVGDQLTKIGIRTKVLPITLGDLTDLLFKRSGREFEGHMFGFSAFVDPYLDAERPFQQYGCTFKPSWICLSNIEELRDKANAIMNPAERLKVLHELVRTAHNEGVGLHIQHGVDIYGVNKRVKNFQNWNRRLIFEGMEISG